MANKTVLYIACLVRRPEDFRDAALLVERREGKLKLRDVGEVDVRVCRAFGFPNRVLGEPLRQHEPRQ